MIRIAAALGAGLLLAGAVVAQPNAEVAPLLAAIESAPVTVLARVDAAKSVDISGYVATLTVLQPLRGAAAGAPITVLWEELSRGRPARLANGQTVLVALVELPTGSLWRQRAADHPGARTIAGSGNALVHDPSPRDVQLLTQYAALAPDAEPALRASALLGIAGTASPAIAVAALERLRRVPALTAAIPDKGLVALLETASDGARPPALRVAIVELAAVARRPATRPALERLARPGSALEPEALTAIAAAAGGLPPARAEALLDRPEAAVRAVGARFVSGNAVERRLPALVRSDPDARVRAAAAVALAATHTAWGVDGCVPALADPDPSVRSAAAEALGALGAPVVSALEDVARTNPEAARGALTALALAGPTGEQALRRFSTELQDPKLRAFARLALGQGPKAH